MQKMQKVHSNCCSIKKHEKAIANFINRTIGVKF
jgi:hypothetical protein